MAFGALAYGDAVFGGGGADSSASTASIVGAGGTASGEAHGTPSASFAWAITAAGAVASDEAHGVAAVSTDVTPVDGDATPGYLLTGPRRRLEINMRSVTNPGFDPKEPAERLRLGFDFGLSITSVSSSPAPTVVISRHAGADDPSPESVLDGSIQIVGAKVLQWVTAGIDGCDYLLKCTATGPSGERIVLSGVLQVRAA